jgi:hypothetical protein
MYTIDVIIQIIFWFSHSQFIQTLIRFSPRLYIQEIIPITLPIHESQLQQIQYFISTFQKMKTIERTHNMSIFAYMMASGEIHSDTMVFLIDYLDIPILQQQMYDHLSSVNNTQNIFLCKAIIGTYGFDYLQSIKAFRFLIRSTSLPRKFRKHMSIATFFHTDNQQIHDRVQQFITTGRRGKAHVHSHILCQICLRFNFGGDKTQCCNQGYHITCGYPHRVIMNKHFCRFCFKELKESNLQLIHARHQQTQFNRLKYTKRYHPSKKVIQPTQTDRYDWSIRFLFNPSQ